MKNCILLLVSLITSLDSFSQQYQQFPTNNGAYWVFTRDDGNANFMGRRFVYLQHMIVGDTVINNVSYKLIVERAYLDSSNLNTPVYINRVANVPDKPIMAFREDNKSIYVMSFNVVPGATPVEHLAIDYNLQSGDSVKGLDYYGDTVSGYDSVLVGSTYHKRWLLGTDKFIIEGVGGKYAYFFMHNGQNIVRLSCFNNGSNTYSQNGASCFYLYKYDTPAAVGAVKELTDISISPNPFGNRLTINSVVPVNVNIYNSFGQIVLSYKQVLNRSIDTEILPGGVYFADVTNDNGNRQVIKLIK